PDHDPPALHHRQGQNASHAPQFVVPLRQLENPVVGEGDGPPHPPFHRAGFFEDGTADGVHGRLRSQFARRVAADAVHHQKHATLGIHPVPVFIAVPQEPGVGGGAGVPGVHRRPRARWTSANNTTNARNAITKGMCRLYGARTIGPHFLASKASFSTSAMRISARSGRGSSTPGASRRPFSQVPLRLLSRIAKAPLAGSRRSRRCSRETSSLVYSGRSTQRSSPPRPTLISFWVIKYVCGPESSW